MATKMDDAEILRMGIRTDMNLIYTLLQTISTCIKLSGEITDEVTVHSAYAVHAAAVKLTERIDSYVDLRNRTPQKPYDGVVEGPVEP